MISPSVFETSNRQKIAYSKSDAVAGSENLPGIVFLGGLRSDMAGTKALDLEARTRAAGRSFLRFDYSGHGASSGSFVEGSVGDWAEDARQVIFALTDGPQILVGSSMGGWIGLLIARDHSDKVAALVGIATAPDFTEDGMWAKFDASQRAAILRDGQIALPSEYSDEPYLITARLIEDGRNQLVLRKPLRLAMPVRLLHGTADNDVAQDVPLRLLAHAEAEDMRLTLVKGADHRFSTPENLDLLWRTVDGVTTAILAG